MSGPSQSVLLFESVSATLMAERILRAEGIPSKTIPVPKHISSDCGVCIRVEDIHLDQAKGALQGKVTVAGIRPID